MKSKIEVLAYLDDLDRLIKRCMELKEYHQADSFESKKRGMEWTLKESCRNDFTIWKPDPHRKTEDEIAERIYELERLIERCNRYGEPSATRFIKSQLTGLEWVLKDSDRISYEKGQRYLKNQENKECKN